MDRDNKDFGEEKETKFIYITINRFKKQTGVKEDSQVIGLIDSE